MKIVVFGDSILKGVITTPSSDRIFDITENDSLSLAQKKINFELDNRSIYGNIITKGQLKFNKWLEKGETANICIIEFGGNDCDYDWQPISENPNGEYQQKVPLQDYLRILNEMICKCREHKITPVLMTMPPLVPEYWINTISKKLNKENILKFINDDINKLYRNHEVYNINLTKYAYENNIKLVDIRSTFLETPNYKEYMCLDGIHPNEKGYALMAKKWIEALQNICHNEALWTK